MKDTIPARVTLAIFLVATFIHGLCAQSPATTQATLDQAAAGLDIKLAVWTNHILTNSHKVVFQLANTGKVPILVDDDWRILFSMRDGKTTTQPEYVVHGLRLKKSDGCFFEISKKPGANPKFPGLKPGDKFIITVDSFTGLSVFKYDIDNKFVITANDLAARVIASTASDDLNFVFLSQDNKTRDDPSSIDPYERYLIAAEVPDAGRVGRNVIVPAAKNISEMSGALIDLNDTVTVFLYFTPTISNTFQQYVQNELLTVPGVNQQKLRIVNAPSNAVGVGINVIIAPDATKTKDGYKFTSVFDQAGRHTITLTAKHESGLSNAMETFLSLLGIYSVVPAITIEDDADTGIRSVKLDVTKTFFPVTTVLKLLRLMKMYKFNELVLVLGSDDAMRVPLVSTADFKEIELFATNECLGKTSAECNPSYYKASQAYSSPGKGMYTVADFVRILTSAKTLSIDVVPYVNLIGCLRSVKKASHLRYERLKASNPTEAERLHLMSSEPTIPTTDLPVGSCNADCMLDPCNPATLTFAQDVFDTFKDLYSMADVPFTKFNAGGDGFTKYFGQFSSCTAKGFDQAGAMRYLLEQLSIKAKANGAKLRVNEEAVIDPTTGTCITTSSSSTYTPEDLQVEFSNLAPGDMADWGLTPAQLEFLVSQVIPYNDSDPKSIQDPLRTFNGPKKGLAPWGRAYSCANNGYKVILNPRNFFHLDNAYELDFGELGTFNKDGFFVVNNFRLQTYEPLNMHINMDISSTGGTFLPYRFAQIFRTEPLTKPGNVVGLEASVDTRVIRTEEQLWYALLPRLLVISQKMWRRSEFENTLRVEEPNTLIDLALAERRTAIMRFELLDLIHNLGYKEFGRLEAKGYTYRIPKVEAFIRFGIASGQPTPWPLMAKADVPGTEIEIREINGNTTGPWRDMFTVDPITEGITGGYLFNFPPVKGQEQKVELRTKQVLYMLNVDIGRAMREGGLMHVRKVCGLHRLIRDDALRFYEIFMKLVV
ncbi:hypothetical protein DPMN_001001 [Dreissena polymorpha]|uniref:beta-N-acetylhexosaminidase n=1 Tax=Dreissena polymorpha TaxID=45954 RepID=A0A9D4MGY9_DREPO|nr:hypothetical protein DPMN_001001 [Dreissena polymorpha]